MLSDNIISVKVAEFRLLGKSKSLWLIVCSVCDLSICNVRYSHFGFAGMLCSYRYLNIYMEVCKSSRIIT